jgi:hypothetical protein
VVSAPQATLPPPAASTPRFHQPEVIPVTGVERMPSLPQDTLPQQIFLNLGIGLVSVALVLFGVSRKFQ